MKDFKELDKRCVHEVESSILTEWKKQDILNKTIENRKGASDWVFYDGPATANGMPGLHHMVAKFLKDTFCKYQTMKGNRVLRKIGWDTHGLPVEVNVEKKLGFSGKNDIEKYGIKEFNELCKETVWDNENAFRRLTDEMGQFIDLDNRYITYDNNYIETEWWILKKFFDEGLFYEGVKIMPWCPRCGTGLASHEVAQGYKEIDANTVTVTFKKKDEDVYFLVWTTTPWTLISNVGLCVNPNENYVLVESQGYKFILAEALATANLGDDYKVLETMKGKDLEFTEYEQLIPSLTPSKKAFIVMCDEYVTMSDGTGIVHIAPAFGEDDAKVGRKYDLPFVQLVDEKGEMKPEVTDMAGVFCKKADELVFKSLAAKKLLFKALKFEHSYPFCWRCDTPLIYYARESWFIKMTDVKDDLIANNKTINWIPETIGKGRFGDWLENVQDWGVSRNRYWGTPLNIWECECGCQHSIGSIEELKSMSDNCPDEIELHRPYIDAVTIKCPDCGKEMHRVPEVIDCWFDSGSMPFAQHHYPFENKDLFEKQFPADFISEAVDQTRGWFYSLLAISTLLFNKAPYKNVIVLGHVQDKEGKKMSKSKGNAVDPMEALTKFGADAIRWYFYINSAPWLPNRFYEEAVTEGQRKFMGTLWNTYAFFVLYAEIDQFDATKYTLEYDKLTVMDKWLLSKLNTVVKTVDYDLANYKIPEAAKALQEFVDEMSNWYVRRGRERFWAKGMEQDKINAYMTLYTALVTISKAAAPMIPFMTEDIYQNLVRSLDKDAPESVHLCDFPEVNEAWIDEKLEADMEEVLNVVVLGRACRNTANIKNRQPIGKMYVKAENELSDFYTQIIEEELNVKEVCFTQDVRNFTSYQFKPQLKTLGRRFGKNINAVKEILANLDGNQAMDEINEKGTLTITVDGNAEVLENEDLLIEAAQMKGFVSESDHGVTVVLDTKLTDELVEEGFVLEIISKIQTMRKEADFEVMDRINVYADGNEKIAEILKNNTDAVKGKVLAENIILGDVDGYVKEWDINGETVTMAVEKINL